MTDYPGAGQQPGQWPGPQGPAGGPPPPYGPPPGPPQQGGFPPGQSGYPPPGPGYPPPDPSGPGGPGGFPPGGFPPGGFPPGGFPPGGPGGPGFPPGPGGPGYGPYGPPPGGRSKTPWIIGGVAVVAVAAIVVALVLVMGGSKGSSGAKGALDKLLNAAKTRDLKTAQNLTCAPLSGEFITSPLAAVTKWKIGDANEQDTAATVPFTATAANGEKNYTAAAQKQDGQWKICDVQEGGSGGGGGGGGGDAAAAQQVVQKVLQAGKDRDLTTAKDLTCEPLHSEVESFPEISSFQVGAGNASGSSATVPFTVTSEGKTTSNVAELQQQSGSWKVCNFHTDSGGSGGSSGSGVPSSSTDFPTDFPTDIPSGFPTGGGTGSICVTPAGSTPFCIPQ